jgi:hypothetical protein
VKKAIKGRVDFPAALALRVKVFLLVERPAKY